MGGGLPPISSYKIYKVDNVPELQKVQERLKAHGLKDPWLRYVNFLLEFSVFF
jgi:hypothetical protein